MINRPCAVFVFAIFGLLGGFAIIPSANAQTLPPPNAAGFEHVVVVMMENRSFDHFFGWLPGANGQQAGLTYLDSQGNSHPTHSLSPDYQGCGFLDPGHSYSNGRVQYHNGGADGWLLEGSGNDTYAIGYYGETDPSFLAPAAQAFTICDNYFAGILSATFPNRIYMHAAQTDRLDNDLTVTSTLPTIWSRLEEKGYSGRYYFSDEPFLSLWGARYQNISKPFTQFLADAQNGTLPNVSFIDPRFGGEEQGTSNDDHPHADIRNGEAFLNQVYDALRTSPNWSKTVLVINYDEWGGFYDHVPPPLAPIPTASAAAGDTDGRLGFRVPCVVISPYARRGYIAHAQYDHTSILRMIEWRFGLPPLTVRDETANNLAEVLNFAQPEFTAPVFTVPPGPFGTPCLPLAGDEEAAEWAQNIKDLRALAIRYGFHQ
ncbi:MAG: alkaline phosphatase family protein [Chthoniobacterales bacterium]